VSVARHHARIALAALALTLASLLGACHAPGGPAVSSKPGWGWRSVPDSARMTVRAVPAAVRPEVPVTRLSKPGWGARSR
jgi:hypothetical protein